MKIVAWFETKREIHIYNFAEILEKLLFIESPNCESILHNYNLTPKEFAGFIANKSYNLLDLGLTKSKRTTLLSKLLPNKPVGNSKVHLYLLHKYSFSYCTNCARVLEIEEFSKASNASGLSSWCKICSSSYNKKWYVDNADYRLRKNALRRLRQRIATPAWANLEAIVEIYTSCPKGYHVDHIIPLKGTNVCGLHIETNLQYLLAKHNMAKGNKF